jgi:copper homeostasis protein
VTQQRIILEVAVQSVADAIAAEQGGADRLELCAALELGGLTPSLGLFQAVRAAVSLPIVVMLRPRAGNFVYSLAELDVMRRDLLQFLPLQPDGFVFGLLHANGDVDTAGTGILRELCGPSQAVFHRAFDETADRNRALDALIRLSFTRILSSGGKPTAVEGSEHIHQLRCRADRRIELLPCGQIRSETAVRVLQSTGCTQLHGAFAQSSAGFRQTDAGEVAATRRIVDHFFALGSSASG